MRWIRPLVAALVLGALLAVSPSAGAADAVRYDVAIPGYDGSPVWATVYRPAGADADNPVPVILHSHGWGGTRSSTAGAFQTELGRGFAVVSFDQRGFGQTGGRSTVQNPEREGRDVVAVIDYVASLDWTRKNDGPGGSDPVLFAMGGSYGGGYQLIGSLTEIRERGRTRFDALAPEIAWYDLAESLAPQAVARTAWATALYAAGIYAHEDDVHVALAWSAATGQWPDGSVPGVPNLQDRFHANSPVAFVEQGHTLDVPVLLRQGTTDNLFNLNQGWKNFERTLSPAGRERSIFVGYNGGHALPSLVPTGYASGSDACSPGGFTQLRLAFFEAVMAGADPRALVGGAAYSLTTVDGRCVQVAALDARTPIDLGSITTTTGAGPVQQLAVADGPLTVAGIPVLEADVTTIGADQRVFFGLSVGDSPVTARLVQHNVLPLRELAPVAGAPRTVELPGLAVDVPAGQRLYLTVSPVSDMSFGHGSARTPGVVLLENLVLQLPVAS